MWEWFSSLENSISNYRSQATEFLIVEYPHPVYYYGWGWERTLLSLIGASAWRGILSKTELRKRGGLSSQQFEKMDNGYSWKYARDNQLSLFDELF